MMFAIFSFVVKDVIIKNLPVRLQVHYITTLINKFNCNCVFIVFCINTENSILIDKPPATTPNE